MIPPPPPPRRRGRGTLIGPVLALFVGIAACDSNKLAELDCIPTDADTLLVSASANEVVRPAGVSSPTTVTLTVAPYNRGATRAVTAAAAVYGLDLDSDGVFERTFTGATVAVQLAEPRSYPVQVSGTRCDGQALIGTTTLVLRSAFPPRIALSFAPSAAQGVRINTSIDVAMTIDAEASAAPFQLHWSWGDGTDNTREVAAAELGEAIEDGHVFTEPAVHTFRATVTGANGLVGTTSTTLFASARVFDAYFLDLGQDFTAAEAYTMDLSAPTANTAFAIAAGRSGMLAATEAAAGPRLGGRIATDPEEANSGHDVAVDARRRIAYLAAGERGAVPVDVTDPTQPAYLAPFDLIPDGTGELAIDRVWLCNGDDWIFVRNAGDAIYGFELYSSTELNKLRGTGNGNPWRQLRAIPGDLFTPILRLGGTASRDLSCVGDRFVAVASPTEIQVYDLVDYFQLPPDKRVVTTVPVRGSTEATNEIHRIHLQPGTAATGTDNLELLAAEGDVGALEYVVDVSAGTHTLRKRFWVQQRSGLAGVDDPIRERILDAHATPGTMFVLASVPEGDDTLYVFDREQWPGEITRVYDYIIEDKCRPTSYDEDPPDVDQGDTTFGDAFPDLVDCRPGVPATELQWQAPTRTLWMRDAARLMPYYEATGSLGTDRPLPPPVDAYAVADDRLHAISRGRHMVFDRTAVEAALGTGLQPAPVVGQFLDLALEQVVVSAAGGHAVGTSNNYLALYEIDAGGGFAIAASATAKNVRQVAVHANGTRVAVRFGTSGEVRAYKPIGGELVEVATMGATPMNDVVACAGDFYAWHLNGEDRREIVRIAGNNTVDTVGDLPLEYYTDLGCADGRLLVASGPPGGMLGVDAYEPGGDLGEPLWSLELPMPTEGGYDWIEAAADGDWLALHLRGLGGGILFYRLQGTGAPVFTGVDFTATVGELDGFQVRSTPDGARISGLATLSGGTRALRVKRVQAP